MRNLKCFLVLFLIVMQTLQAQEVEKKVQDNVEVKKELNKAVIDTKKTKVQPPIEVVKKKSRKRDHPEVDSITPMFALGKTYPNSFRHIATYPKESHLGDKVHSEGIQGLAHSPNNWYWTRASWKMTKDWKKEESYIYKMQPNHMSRRIKVAGVPSEIWNLGWHHLSDPDYYKGYLYVPIEKGKENVPSHSLTPLILIYDEDLNYLGSAPLSYYDSETGRTMTSGGAWCAINPTNGLLYVSRGSGNGSNSNYSVLDVYDPILDVEAETQAAVFRLFYRYSVKLNFRNNWDARTYIQGGVFSPEGLFYYVMDPKFKYDLHSQSGVHVFEINGEIGTEIIVEGRGAIDDITRELTNPVLGAMEEIIAPDASHIKRTYRLPYELEGLDFVSPNERIYHNLLSNMRDIDVQNLIEQTGGVTTGFLLLTRLSNDFGEEDEVNLFHYQLIKKVFFD